MTSKVQFFNIVIVSVVGLFSFVLFSLNKDDIEREKQIKNLINITKLPGLSLSTSFLENRILTYSDDSNNIYFDMKTHDYIEHIYAK